MVQNIREESVPVRERLNLNILQIRALGQKRIRSGPGVLNPVPDYFIMETDLFKDTADEIFTKIGQ